MRVVIFGASGKTGRLLVEGALREGHRVRAFVRDRSKITMQHEHLQIFEGDVLDVTRVEEAVENCGAVLSALGHTKNSTNDVQTRGTENIVGAMRKHGKRRLVSLTGAGVRDPEDRPKLADRAFALLLGTLMPSVLRDAEGHAEVIQQSGLDWVIVRAPRLTDGPATNCEYRVGLVDEKSGTSVSRADVADFMLRQLTADEYLREMPMVSSGKEAR